MTNIKEIEVEIAPNETETYVIIDLGNDEYRSLPKVQWEKELAQQAEQSTPIDTGDE
jgi:hypothetical protein